VVGGADGLVATPLALPVFMSTGTVSLRFDQCFIGDDQIISIESADEWRARDRYSAAIGNPVTHGLAERSARLLADIGERDRDAADAARRIQDDCDVRAADFDELLDAIDDSDEFVARASAHRAACIGLAHRAATALLAAVGGRGMDLSHPAQRIAREADFFVIQAQTFDGRAATLRSV
jgi:hypothetical protein